jgi:phage terminase small subunit
MTLTAKQQSFVDLYIINLNATNKTTNTQLAINAGYGVKSAHVTASHLLKNPKIKDAIQSKFTINAMSANETLHHLSDIARGTVKDSDLGSRLRALDLMAKHHNLTNRHELSGANGEPIVYQLIYPE